MIRNPKLFLFDWFPVASPVIFFLTFTVLGFITPGYSQVTNVISRLSIEKYGWVQQVNFVQLALGIFLSTQAISKNMIHGKSKKIIRITFYFCSVLLILATFFPTDPIENQRFVSLSLFTPLGLLHAGVVIIFLALSPYGIYHLSKLLRSEPYYKNLAKLTAIMGYGALIMSLTWFLFLGLGWFMNYRGLFQKIIATWTLAWLVIINLRTINNTKYHQFPN